MADDSRIDLDGRRPPEHVDRGAPSRGARTGTGILPNGRVLWLRIDPPLAPAVAVNHLAQVVEHTARWGRAATESQSDAVARLSRAVAADAKRLSDGELGRASALRRRIVAGDRKIDRKLTKAAEEYRARIERQVRIERETVRRLGQRSMWDWIVIVSALPLFAAYGQRGRPFGENNVALALSLLIWLVGDEVMDLVFGSEKASPYPLRDTDAWSYLAPIGNVLAGWWLLSDRQHERFIASRVAIAPDVFTQTAGATEFAYRCTFKIGLSPFVAVEHFPDFVTFKEVPVVATISSIPRNTAGSLVQVRRLNANVLGGELTISIDAVAPNPAGLGAEVPRLDPIEVAWIIDTQDPVTPTGAN